MKVLLDECVTRYIKRDLAQAHIQVATIDETGLKGLKNGALLQAMKGVFDVLVTVDQNLEHQQNVSQAGIAVIVLVAYRNTYAALSPLIPQMVDELQKINPGEIVRIGTKTP